MPPIKLLRKAAAGWGTLAFKPVDADYGVRQLFPGSDIPSATWKAAEVLGAEATREPRESTVQRWINYYGPKNTFSSVNFARALDPKGCRRDSSKTRSCSSADAQRSVIWPPAAMSLERPIRAARINSPPGLEIHATVLLNLLRGEWLTRMPDNWEAADYHSRRASSPVRSRPCARPSRWQRR